jgi:hypothetical protein
MTRGKGSRSFPQKYNSLCMIKIKLGIRQEEELTLTVYENWPVVVEEDGLSTGSHDLRGDV